MGATYLSSSAVNSGNAVNLGVTKIQYAFGSYTKEEELPGRFTTSDAVGTVDFVGWGNPKIQIEGVFDVNLSLSNWINLSLLKDFAKTTQSVYILDDVFYPSWTKIQIAGFKISRQPDEGARTTQGSIEGSFIRYSIEAIESI